MTIKITEIIEKVERDAREKTVILINFSDQLHTHGDVILQRVTDNTLEALRELELQTLILEDNSKNLMHNLHKLKSLGEYEATPTARTHKSLATGQQVTTLGLRITFK